MYTGSMLAIYFVPAGLLKMVIVSKADFGEGHHYRTNEPVFYDSAYCVWPKDQPPPLTTRESVFSQKRLLL